VTSTFDPPETDPASSRQPGDPGAPGTSPQARRPTLPPAARAFLDWVVVVGVALFVAIMVRTFLLAHFVVEGESMLSTLHTGDRVFVNKLSYRLHDPHRGDVVVLHELTGASERDLDEDPNDAIPPKKLIEPYLDPQVVSGTSWCEYGPTLVPKDNVFVMGDNRPGSSDSRTLGPIPIHDIVGRAFIVFWPKAHWQWL
jgi:signal peptidase I